MKLVITTPTAVVAEIGDVAALRAEDASGLFGILDGHADFLTVLAISVLSWRERGGREGNCAVRGGVLTVTGGKTVAVATREAVVSDDLDRLEHEVLDRFRQTRETEQAARATSQRLHLAAIRRMLAYLRPERVTKGMEASSPYGDTGGEA
ncbi:MAG TPA: F0F1 ATP synthase subunit epsilon [Stellaceae bacterium]|nr:F0F1 ATP synthase subunit epsilon [Stellaceae bacterium]